MVARIAGILIVVGTMVMSVVVIITKIRSSLKINFVSAFKMFISVTLEKYGSIFGFKIMGFFAYLHVNFFFLIFCLLQ